MVIELNAHRMVALAGLGVVAAAAATLAATLGGIGVAAFYAMAALCAPLVVTALAAAGAVQRARKADEMNALLLEQQTALIRQTQATRTMLGELQNAVIELSARQQARPTI